jgi:hypothetical protein
MWNNKVQYTDFGGIIKACPHIQILGVWVSTDFYGCVSIELCHSF